MLAQLHWLAGTVLSDGSCVSRSAGLSCVGRGVRANAPFAARLVLVTAPHIAAPRARVGPNAAGSRRLTPQDR